MAKRYHQDRKDRMHERRGEDRYEERAMHRRDMTAGRSMKQGMDPRRRQEMEDAGMINEDHKAVANLPQEVKYHDWPSQYDYPRYGLDDTISGIDRQEREDYEGMERTMQKGKY